MKKILVLACLLMPIFLISFLSCNNSNKKPKEDEVTLANRSADANPACNCEPDWFPHSQTPAPAEGVGSPFDTQTPTNCMFHQWSWQKFLWLTKPLPSGHPLFEDSMILVDNQMVPVAPVGGVALVLTDDGQAGSGGILQSNAAFSSNGVSDTVYYSIYTNATLQKAADSFKNLIIKDPALLNNRYVFPIGSLELKVAWVNVTALPASQASSYYTTEAILQPSGKKITAALLGMHVVGVVINHPEFIWATFEHNDMAPEYNWRTNPAVDVPVSSPDAKLFFPKGDTSTYVDLQWPVANPSHQKDFAIYPFGVPRVADPAKDSFMQTSQKEPVNINNLKGLNACVAPALAKDVWQNYFYNGSIWLSMDNLTPAQQADTIAKLAKKIGNVTPGTLVRGSTACYNITMETFMQDVSNIPIHTMQPTNLFNCFTCHNSLSTITLSGKSYPNSNSPLYLSHIFRSYLSVSTGVPVKTIEKLRVMDLIDVIKTKRAENNK